MKSPVIKTEYEIVKEQVEVPVFYYVEVSHNCVLPEAADSSRIQYADGLIMYLVGEYKLKYEACLNSLRYDYE